MSGYPKATCDPGTEALRLANERADRWKQRHDALAARLASVKALADEWETEGESLIKHAHSGRDVHEGSTMVSLADILRAVLGSDAHTEQKGTGR